MFNLGNEMIKNKKYFKMNTYLADYTKFQIKKKINKRSYEW